MGDDEQRYKGEPGGSSISVANVNTAKQWVADHVTHCYCLVSRGRHRGAFPTRPAFLYEVSPPSVTACSSLLICLSQNLSVYSLTTIPSIGGLFPVDLQRPGDLIETNDLPNWERIRIFAHNPYLCMVWVAYLCFLDPVSLSAHSRHIFICDAAEIHHHRYAECEPRRCSYRERCVQDLDISTV